MTFEDFGLSLMDSGRVPSPKGVPVAAWALARLAALCGRRFPFYDAQVCGSDGDDFWLEFIAFSAVGLVRPVGTLALCGDRAGVRLYVDAAPPSSPVELRDAFSAALLNAPLDVLPICIVVVYTSVEDENFRWHVPYTLGWDGSRYVFEDSPQYTCDPEDV